MYMGQLMTGDVAVQCFTKGIEIMKKQLKSQKKQVGSPARRFASFVSSKSIGVMFVFVVSLRKLPATWKTS